MNKFIQLEIEKRDKARRFKQKAQKNWLTKRNEINKIFHTIFDKFQVDGKEFYIDLGLNDEFSNKKYVGYDCVQVTHPLRLTGNVVITKKEEATNFDSKKEVGAALSVTCSRVGGYDIFLIPSNNDDRLIEVKSILLYSTNDPLKLTKKIIHKCVKNYLIFQRVDSLLEEATVFEKLRIQWLYFMDIRNRESRRSLLFQITNHWGAVVLSALAAWIIAKNT